MANYAYLRVSTDRQDVDSQKHRILSFANQHDLGKLEFVEDTASSRIKWRSRKLGQLLEKLSPQDTIVFAEISRIARSTLQVLEVLEYCTQNQLNVYIAKQKMILDRSMQSKITATVFGLAAEIEREFISTRTTEALAARKKAGMQLGRPAGPAKKTRLDKHRKTIEGYLAKGLSVRAIGRIINEPSTTVNDYIRRHDLRANLNQEE